ncbi:FecCD family ABC transporter permease [Amycolatopsis suaedae]|uniref:Iron ABC transporter permease n=1 Tax=Amycolatopsis suaedae TaxID=2510978 RepID=A0A4V2ELV9_9PSEU|nr:iron chelate uptake ABC transporter family permease subunit [Amycolatopsis suaedae]RZQ62925.1 iron ABC transporter permease [Amycolatopsis suaedae]
MRIPARGLALAAVLAALAVAALMFGEPFVGVNRLLPALTADGGIEHVVVAHARAPRVVLALAAGAALGVAGLLLRESLRNPLAVPELLGVSTGAAAAVTVCVVFGITVPGAPTIPALAGAVAGGVLTLLAVRRAVGPAATLLIGAAVSAALQAVLLAAHAMSDSRDQGVLVRYLLGSLTGTGWAGVGAVAVGLLVTFPLAVLTIPVLGALRLGDDTALGIGVRADRARPAVLLVACGLVAVVVAHCGPVAWVGFLAPHLAQAVVPRGDLRLGMAWSASFGAVLVLAADTLARTLLYPVELPVGGLTAVVAVAAGAALAASRRRTVLA